MYDPARAKRIRRGSDEEPDDRSARWLVSELSKCLVSDPAGDRHSTRYDELIGGLEAVCERAGLEWQPKYKSLGAWGKATNARNVAPMFRGEIAKKTLGPVLDALEGELLLVEPVDEEPLDGWENVHDRLRELRAHFLSATTPTDFSNVARECREVFVTLADLAYDRKRHGPTDGDEAHVIPRLNAVVEFEAAGGSEAERRKLIKTTIALANKLQHRQSVTQAEAADACEATITSARMIERLLTEGE